MISFDIHEEIGVVVVEVFGDTSMAEIRACIDTVAADERYSSDYPGVFDLRRVGHGVAPEEATGLGQYVSEHRLTRARWAILASTPNSTAVSLFYEDTASSQHRVQIFSTVEAASTFIGIELSGLLRAKHR